MQEEMKFNIRVYGILIENNAILIVDEKYKGRDITKFPGGGMNTGESTIECLKREIKEELNIDVEVLEHYYTTDFFQQSAFRDNEQILSIYYTVKRSFEGQPINLNWQELANDHKAKFRWLNLKEIEKELFTFPIDKKVSDMIKTTSWD